MKKTILILFTLGLLSGCEAEIGTQSWCDSMNEMPKSDWTAQVTFDYAKHCVLMDAVGSPGWCEGLEGKPKGDWSTNEATSYAKHCVF
ncbi:DUF3012 domain-containing protein [Vibrio sp. FNV 38]|nr:DUF3012 domain-containing protein [Vibrio sp. FNV 38]